MKTLIGLVILAAAVYFGWQYAPDSVKDKLGSATDSLKPAKSSATSLLSTLRDKFGPEDQRAKHALLLNCLSENLKKMNGSYAESTLSAKIAYAKAQKESGKILEILKNENIGISSLIMTKFVNSIIPAASSTATTSEPDCSSLIEN